CISGPPQRRAGYGICNLPGRRDRRDPGCFPTSPTEAAMKLNNLEDLFVLELQDMYDAEKQLVKALPKMAKAATSEPLRTAFQEHLEQTEKQVERLEEVFQQINQKP